jgi:hypothetical protein
MKNLLLASLSMFLLLACSSEYSGVPNSSGVFQLNRIDNIFFTKDNGLLITGVYKNKLTIIKTNSDFGIEWSKSNYEWGTNASSGSGWGSSFYSVQVAKMFQRNDGTYVCVGSVEEGGDVVYSKTLLVELNRRGEQTRIVEFSGLSASSALQTNDGGYVLFGTKLTKLDRNFNQLWQKNIYDFVYYPVQIIATTDGGFAMTGSYNNDQAYLKKYDSKGVELLNSVYKHNDFPFEERGFDLVQLADNGFLIVGRTANNLSQNSNIDCQIIRTNSSGDTLWTKRFGDSTNDWLDRVVSYNQTEFIIQGTSGFPNDNPKSLLFKISNKGEVLDSVRTKQFPLMVYSPLKYYIKAQNVDADHIGLFKISADKLFR